MGITQFVQTKLNPAPTDPVQAKMFTFMPLIFTFMFATFPAGLVIYYTWNNLLSVTQQYVIMRREGREGAPVRESRNCKARRKSNGEARMRKPRASFSPGRAISSGARGDIDEPAARRACPRSPLSAAPMPASRA